MDIQIITAPLVGGIIGLVTNGIAIRMLFRPLKPIFIGRFKLPFTPGLIPKERERIAAAIGEIISRELINEDTLKKTLLSDNMRNNISEKIDDLAARYSDSEDTIGLLAERFFSDNVVQEKLNNAKEILAETIAKKAVEQDIGKTIVDYAYEEIISKTKPMLKSLTSSALKSVKQPFAGKINNMIDQKSRPLIEKFIAAQTEELLRMPIRDIIEKYRDKISQLKSYFWSLYEEIITEKLSDVLYAVNISELVYNKINELDLMELEKMIMALMKKELNALIWLGGLLGLIMGVASSVFS